MQIEPSPVPALAGQPLKLLRGTLALGSWVVVGGSKWAIRGYRRFLSPLLTPSCRFSPSCSVYALGCLEQLPPRKAYPLIVKRILRCHPWGGQGWDPVPERADQQVKVGEPAHLAGLCSHLEQGVIPCGSSSKGEMGRAHGGVPGISPAVGTERSRGRNEQR